MYPENYLATWKLGNICLQGRQFDKAVPYLKAIRQRPDLAQAYQDLGKLYMQTHDDNRALPYLKKVVELSADEPSTHYLLSEVYRKMGNTAEARSEMELFEKLKKAESERRRPPDAMLAGIGGKAAGVDSRDTPDPH